MAAAESWGCTNGGPSSRGRRGGTEHHLGTRRTPQSHTLAISTQHKVAGNGSLLVTELGPAAPPRCPQDHGCRDRDSAPRCHPGAHLDAAWRGLTGLPVLGNFQVVFVRGDKAVPVPRARPRPLQDEKGARAEVPRGGWKCSRASDRLENHCTPGERKRSWGFKVLTGTLKWPSGSEVPGEVQGALPALPALPQHCLYPGRAAQPAWQSRVPVPACAPGDEPRLVGGSLCPPRSRAQGRRFWGQRS